MADRSTFVTIGARVDGFVAGLNKAKAETTKFSKGVSLEVSKNSQEFTELGGVLATAGAVGAAGLGLTIAKFAEFDQSMSFVQAATHETAGNMEALRDAALEAGASTVFSATESANAIEELSKAGLTTADILGGALTGSLDLAAAGGLGVARAAEISATALQQFKLEGDQAAHVADVLAAGAGKAMGSVDDLANGLKFVGPVAASMNISLEETTGVLALFAQQGIIGEQAGTGLRGVLASLTAPSKLAAKEIENLGLTLYDQQGSFLGLENAAGQLNAAYAEMDEESRNASMGIIFGRETITSATALYQAGAEGVQEWTAAVDDAGYAAETAQLRLDNLTGDIEALGGAFDTAAIKTGAYSDDALRGVVQGVTGLLDLYNNAPAAVQGGTLALTAIGTAAALAGGAFFLAAPKVVAFNAALQTLRTTAPKTTAAMGAVGKGFGALAVATVAVTALDAVADALDGVEASSEELTNKLSTLGLEEAIDTALGDLKGSFGKDFFNDTTVAAENFGGVLDAIGSSADTRAMGIFGDVFTGKSASGVNKARDAVEGLGSALAAMPLEESSRLFREYADEQDLTTEQMLVFIDASGEFKNSLIEQATAAGLAADEETILALALGEGEAATRVSEAATREKEAALASLTGVALTAEEQIEDLAETVRGFGSAALNTRDASRQFQGAIDDLTESVKTNGATLDINTEKGRLNESALDGIATSALELAASTYEQTNSQEAASAAIADGRTELIKALGQFNITGKAAEDYADELGLIPENVGTVVDLNTSAAQAELNAFIERTNQRVATINVRANMPDLNGAASGSGRMGNYADGGGIYGVGGPRQDNIPILASVGEHMLDARDVELMGGQSAVYRFREELNRFGRMPRFADGGAVTPRVQYVAEPRRGYASSPTSAGSTMVSLAGARFEMSIEGRTMTGVIREQIVAANSAEHLTYMNGKQR